MKLTCKFAVTKGEHQIISDLLRVLIIDHFYLGQTILFLRMFHVREERTFIFSSNSIYTLQHSGKLVLIKNQRRTYESYLILLHGFIKNRKYLAIIC